MTCDWFREALSARIDGEPGDVPDAVLDAHLAGCVGCRAWAAAADDLARATRIVPDDLVPDLTTDILAVAPQQGPPALHSARGRLRWALGLVAAVQLVLAVPTLVFGDDAGAPVHIAHELGSWDLALAVGFGFAAFRPARAWGMLPLVVALVGCLVLTTGVDVADGHTALAHESAHALEIVGLALLWALARRPATRARRPTRLRVA